MDVPVREGERVDSTGFGGYRIIQGGGFSYGVDSVLLAAFAAGETGASRIRAEHACDSASLVDIGTGNGIIPIIIGHKVPDSHITGIELDEAACDRALRSVRLNGLDERIRIVKGDIRSILDEMSAGLHGGGLSQGAFDAVVMNPPYFRRGSAITNCESAKARARHEITAELSDFLTAAERLLRAGGDLYIVHRTERLADVICEMRGAGIEPKELQLVTPMAGRPANLLLVHGIKGAGVYMRTLPDIAVHTADGGYTAETEKLYERV